MFKCTGGMKRECKMDIPALKRTLKNLRAYGVEAQNERKDHTLNVK